MQYLWLSLKKEKESQEKNNQKESQEEKEIACPRMPAPHKIGACRLSPHFSGGSNSVRGL